MKTSTLVLFIFGLSKLCLSQVTLPEIQYNIEPIWTYISQDTNVIIDPTDSASSIYDRRIPLLVQSDDNALYLAENTYGPRNWAGYDGYLLHCLDIETGDAKWIHHNNHYSGQQKVETILGGRLEFDEEGDIVLLNGINKEISQYITPYFAFRGHYIRRVFDKELGNIKEVLIATDNDSENYNVFGIGQIRSLKNETQKYFHSYSASVDDGNNNKIERIHFYNILPNLSIDSSSFQVLDFTYGDPYSFTDTIGHFSFPHFYNQLNDSTLIVLTGDYNNDNFFESPTESHLVWYDISNINGISEIRSINITDDFPKPNDFSSQPSIQMTEQSVVISQKINPIDGINPNGKRFTWLNWYDKDGNLMAKVDCLQGELKNYSTVKVIMEQDDNLIICLSFISPELGKMGHDFIEIPKNTSNTYKLLTSFETEYTEDYTISTVLISKQLSDHELFIGNQIILTTDDGNSSIFYYYKLNMSDLGIISSIDTPIINNNISVTVSPNPTVGLINVHLQDKDNINMTLINNLGERLMHRKAINTYEEIDISNFKDGIYYIKFHNQDSGLSKTEKIILKR